MAKRGGTIKDEMCSLSLSETYEYNQTGKLPERVEEKTRPYLSPEPDNTEDQPPAKRYTRSPDRTFKWVRRLPDVPDPWKEEWER